MDTVSNRKKGMVVAVLFCGLLTGCSDDCQPVLRGIKSTVEAVASKVTGHMAEEPETPEVENQAPDSDVPAPEQSTSEELAATEGATTTSDDVSIDYRPLETLEDYKNNNDRQPLNLSLPAMYWDKNPGEVQNNGILPDVFQPMISDPRMNLSGRLHWDESEEAKHLSVEDTITGAEVELQFRLP